MSPWPEAPLKRGFGSDNHAGAHPRILEAIARANDGHQPAYGTDVYTQKAIELFREILKAPNAEVFFVFNGTAANVLALSPFLRPFHSVIVSSHAHLHMDECGAPERNLGSKLIVVPSRDAKLTPEMIEPYLIRRGDQHFSQVRAISITQPSEVGTVYELSEIARLSEFARREKLVLHLDGARLVNAAAALGCSLAEIVEGCDAVSFGGTKNGLLFGEAIVFPNPSAQVREEIKYQRKQLMQLPSKTRFIAAQFLEFLGTDLWLENARHANAMARYLAEGLAKSPHATITQATRANGVFVRFPKKLVAKLREQAFFYVWDESTFECRLMTSWDTTPDDIDRFLAKLAEIGPNLEISG